MRARSTLWKQIVAQGDYLLETKIRISDKEYTEISAPVINRALMNSALSVGNCVSSSLSVSILTDDVLSASVPLTVLGRVRNNTSSSEWLEFGTYYINQRDTSYEGLVTVNCYDAMLRTNQSYLDPAVDTSAEWPKTMKAVVKEVAYRLGVSIDSRTRIEAGTDYVVPYPTDLTMMQVLGYIGACHGGNWVITEENALRLVPLTIINESGELPESLITKQFNIIDEYDNNIITVEGDNLIWDTAAESTVETVNVTAVLGGLTVGISKTINGVAMTDSSGNSFTAGDQTGGVFRIDNNPYAAQSICDMLYSLFVGLTYEPFTAGSVIFDPAVELGDKIVIGTKVQSILYTATLNLDISFRASISAPNSEEMSAEYPFLTEVTRMKQTTAELSQAISNAAKDLSDQVSNTDGSVTALQTALTEEIHRASAAEKALADSITEESTKAGNAISALTETVNSHDTSIKEHDTRLKALEDSSADTDNAQATAQLASQVEDLSTSLNETQNTVEDHETRLQAGEALVQQHSESISSQSQALTEANAKIANLENTIATLQNTVSDLVSRVAALESNHATE